MAEILVCLVVTALVGLAMGTTEVLSPRLTKQVTATLAGFVASRVWAARARGPPTRLSCQEDRTGGGRDRPMQCIPSASGPDPTNRPPSCPLQQEDHQMGINEYNITSRRLLPRHAHSIERWRRRQQGG